MLSRYEELLDDHKPTFDVSGNFEEIDPDYPNCGELYDNLTSNEINEIRASFFLTRQILECDTSFNPIDFNRINEDDPPYKPNPLVQKIKELEIEINRIEEENKKIIKEKENLEDNLKTLKEIIKILRYEINPSKYTTTRRR